ncbi:hypothetical protein ABT301_31525 [Streptomyces sp. NPDC000987]|uniref:hypothetical protein n=1 Tax=unclassified Streptomyces TaxID=2593676 RepID=UPI002D78DEB7|nr:hypothetical protein [Streptomyces sp. H51]
MSSTEHATSGEVTQSEAPRSWLPALSGLSLAEIAALDDAVLRPSVERLRRRVDRPLSTIAGSDGS